MIYLYVIFELYGHLGKSCFEQFFLLIDDLLYSAILRSIEQNHCVRMWFYMSDYLFIIFYSFLLLFFVAVFFSSEVVYLQRWHGWCHSSDCSSRKKRYLRENTPTKVIVLEATILFCYRHVILIFIYY